MKHEAEIVELQNAYNWARERYMVAADALPAGPCDARIMAWVRGRYNAYEAAGTALITGFDRIMKESA